MFIAALAVQLLVFRIVLLQTAPSPQPPAAAGPNVWIASSLVRIMRDTPAGASREVQLWAARGEYEAFQLVASGSAGLTNATVVATDLTGPALIPKAAYSLYREQYIRVTQGSPDKGGTNHPLGPGLYPDALVPFVDPDTGAAPAAAQIRAVPFNTAPNENQPIWVDIYVRRDAPAGTYTGSLTLLSDQGSAEVRVSLTVWDFELPLSPSLRSSFAIYQPGNEERPNHEVLLRHKLMPRIVNPRDVSYLIGKYGLNITALWIWTNTTYHNCVMPPVPAASALEIQATNTAPGLAMYVYSADEIGDCPQIFPELQAWAQAIHAAGLKNLVTAAPVPALLDDGSGSGRSVADIWALLPKQLIDHGADVSAAIKKGDEVWSYTALAQDGYSPKWLIDYEPINYRIHGFLGQQQGLTGLLYWNVNNWGPDPWNTADYVENAKPYPGEGMLVYPAAQVGTHGFVPSLRLKMIREGVEDYEYVQILKRAGRANWALREVASVAPDWVRWNHDPRALEDLRFRLGHEIDRLAKQHSLDGGNIIRRPAPGTPRQR